MLIFITPVNFYFLEIIVIILQKYNTGIQIADKYNTSHKIRGLAIT
jgi:hypothetical protein